MAMTDPEELKRMQQQALDTTNAAAQKTLEGFERLTRLNMETARSALEQSTEQIDALLSARDAQTLAELVTSFAKLSPEKFAAYANAVYAISRETGTDLSSMIERQISESNAQLAASLQSLARNATGGSAGASDFISQSMSAAKSAYDQMQAAAQQFTSGAMGGMNAMSGMGGPRAAGSPGGSAGSGGTAGGAGGSGAGGPGAGGSGASGGGAGGESGSNTGGASQSTRR